MIGERVQGYCPMGCGETLFLGDGGYVTCGYRAREGGCPNPSAVSDILEDRETEHVVRIEANRFNVQHPLRERIRNELFECDLHRWLTHLPGPPIRPGVYRAFEQGDETSPWRFEEIR